MYTFFAENKKQSVQQELSRITSNVINQIVQKAQQQYLFPITQSVATLPIEELALLAESMINITSLRRKVALDNNIGTVGGPIDVAIISKCDGFIWLKRKHCNGVQREHNKKLNNGLPILHKVPPKRDYGRYFCIMAEKGGTSHGGLTEKLSLFFHAKKQEVNAYGR